MTGAPDIDELCRNEGRHTCCKSRLRFALEPQWEAKPSFDKFWTFVIERHL
jgi:hypothetical protein